MKQITGYRAFCIYASIKLHFTSNSYDITEYGFKPIRYLESSFNKRRDKNFFEILANNTIKETYISELLISLNVTNKEWYIIDMVENFDQVEMIHTKWKDRLQGLSYIFETETIKMLEDGLKFNDEIGDFVLSQYASGDICFEVFCIYHLIFNFKKMISEDNILYNDFGIQLKFEKYTSIIKFDTKKYKEILKKVLDKQV